MSTSRGTRKTTAPSSSPTRWIVVGGRSSTRGTDGCRCASVPCPGRPSPHPTARRSSPHGTKRSTSAPRGDGRSGRPAAPPRGGVRRSRSCARTTRWSCSPVWGQIAVTVAGAPCCVAGTSAGARPTRSTLGASPGTNSSPTPTSPAPGRSRSPARPRRCGPGWCRSGTVAGGLYSFDALENLIGCDLHSAVRVLPEHQHLEVGDLVRAGPEGYPAWCVVRCDPPRTLVLVAIAPGDTPGGRPGRGRPHRRRPHPIDVAVGPGTDRRRDRDPPAHADPDAVPPLHLGAVAPARAGDVRDGAADAARHPRARRTGGRGETVHPRSRVHPRPRPRPDAGGLAVARRTRRGSPRPRLRSGRGSVTEVTRSLPACFAA
jgi:hypothetical protein